MVLFWKNSKTINLPQIAKFSWSVTLKPQYLTGLLLSQWFRLCQIFEHVDGFCVTYIVPYCEQVMSNCSSSTNCMLTCKVAHMIESYKNSTSFQNSQPFRLFWGTEYIDEHVVYLLIDYIELVFFSKNLAAHNVLMVCSKTVEQRSRRRLFVIFFHIARCQVPGLHISLSVGSKQHLPHKQ